jgi:hypothetical protein
LGLRYDKSGTSKQGIWRRCRDYFLNIRRLLHLADDTSMTTNWMKALLISLIIVSIISISNISIVNASHNGHCVKLWVYTNPVKYVGCVVFHHLTGKALTAANNANINFNSGVVQGQKAPANMKCPSSDKDFCQGWNSVRITSGGAQTQIPGNSTSSTDGGKLLEPTGAVDRN